MTIFLLVAAEIFKLFHTVLTALLWFYILLYTWLIWFIIFIHADTSFNTLRDRSKSMNWKPLLNLFN